MIFHTDASLFRSVVTPEAALRRWCKPRDQFRVCNMLGRSSRRGYNMMVRDFFFFFLSWQICSGCYLFHQSPCNTTEFLCVHGFRVRMCASYPPHAWEIYGIYCTMCRGKEQKALTWLKQMKFVFFFFFFHQLVNSYVTLIFLAKSLGLRKIVVGCHISRYLFVVTGFLERWL